MERGWGEAVWESAQLLRAADTRKKFADRRRSEAPQYWPGEKVWVSSQDMPFRVQKLTQRYIGPYKVIKHINLVTYRLNLHRH